ncbi:unnamed protein product [Triticum turgidum subsp. durum]|uniref:Uncharacterized protein n=1 Tax=Triticum turgidum subsp. durum TaxID=4567 RepID=A0A9R0VHL7_TRITD|nr:unnamed protein product [Triticum turgidum subsp. durum]
MTLEPSGKGVLMAGWQPQLRGWGQKTGEMPVYSKGVSVLMPGQDVPTFIAHPAPAPCPPERVRWPSHQPAPFAGSSSNTC